MVLSLSGCYSEYATAASSSFSEKASDAGFEKIVSELGSEKARSVPALPDEAGQIFLFRKSKAVALTAEVFWAETACDIATRATHVNEINLRGSKLSIFILFFVKFNRQCGGIPR